MVGVKKLSWRALGDYCPHYRRDEAAKWARRDERHERLKRATIDRLKREHDPGTECVEECYLSKDGEEGRLDILCWDRDNAYVVEVKSSPAWRASAHDAAQLLVYASLLKSQDTEFGCDDAAKAVIEEVRAGRRPLRPVLAYRGSSLDDPFIIYLEGSYLGWLDLEELKALYHGVMASARDSYVLGPWCFTCANEDCPISSALRGRA